MGIWIAVFITLAALGSILWAMPSPREKMLSKMRSEALSYGLKVRLVDKKLAASLFPWVDPYQGFTLYGKDFVAGQKQMNCSSKVIRLSEDENIHELDLEDPAKKYIDDSGLADDLPSSSEALYFFAGGVALMWREKNEPDSVARIDECLTRCLKATSLWQHS